MCVKGDDMSDYQERSMHSDPNSPVNRPDWDEMWDCPECGDHTGNMVKEDEPLKDCLDHIEDGDLREHVRAEYAFHKRGWATKDARIYELEKKVTELESCVRYKEGHIEELQAQIAASKQTFDDCTRIAAECLERHKA